jgi:hypothetical protein
MLQVATGVPSELASTWKALNKLFEFNDRARYLNVGVDRHHSPTPFHRRQVDIIDHCKKEQIFFYTSKVPAKNKRCDKGPTN